MTWLGLRYVGFAWDQETPVLNWRTGLVYLAIPIGSRADADAPAPHR